MGPRYLLLAGAGCSRSIGLIDRICRTTDLVPRFEARGITVLVNQACPLIPLGDQGCIIGSLFHRHGPARPLVPLNAAEAASIVHRAGKTLSRSFWGGFVAGIAGADHSEVLRDPSGTFPCYYARVGSLTAFASDADILVAAGLPIDVDCEEIGRQLNRAFVPSPATALGGVRELLAGFSLRVPPGATQEACWSPWDHVSILEQEPDQSAERLRRVVRHCVQAWAYDHGRLLLSVSGGLDSSIIAACLAAAEVETTCLTMFSDDPAGDERDFARTLCNDLGLPLIERPYRLEDIDIDEPLGAHLPRPRDRTQANAYERVHREVASGIGAGAFVTGNGGDHVFGFSQSAAPIADRYLTEGLGSGVARSLRDVCRQTGCSIFDAVAQAWMLLHGPVRRVQPNPLFLKPAFIEALGADDLHHPWLDAPAAALPGKLAHVSTILRVQPNLEASRGSDLPVLSPLMSQPIVELCLGVPSWLWRTGGRDRALARRAFARELPAAVVDRRLKGTPSRFAARLLDHYRPAIRERVLDGRLAANGIVDKSAIERTLAGENPVPDLERVRILEIVNAEAWIRHWTGLQQAALRID